HACVYSPSAGAAAPNGAMPGSREFRRRVVGGNSGASNGPGPRADPHAAGRPRTLCRGSRRRRVAGWGSPLFFCHLLEHLLIEHQLGNQPLKTLDFAFQLPDTARIIDLGGVMLLPPAVVRRVADAE